MNTSSGHWFAVASSRELTERPLGKTRFGQRLVFWRDQNGVVRCLRDQCAHRGAKLSLGKLCAGRIECPFHGLQFDGAGKCLRVPAEGDDWTIPDRLRVPAYQVTERDGYVWLWRGPGRADEQLPAPPELNLVEGLEYGETKSIWNAHYTRCIENVIDFSHIQFVHRNTLGRLIPDPITRLSVQAKDWGFQARQIRGNRFPEQFIEFLYPNLWFDHMNKTHVNAATFVPIDDKTTEVYVRRYHNVRLPILRQSLEMLSRFGAFVIFRDDWPIVSSQLPMNVDDASTDSLLPSDACIVAYRKLRHQYQVQGIESNGVASAAEETG